MKKLLKIEICYGIIIKNINYKRKRRKETLNKKEKKKLVRKAYSNQGGITLIALVVTIVVLLILAGVTLNALFSENGILVKAKDTGNKMDDAKKSDLDAINDLDKWINEKTGTGNGDGEKEDPTEKPKITDSSLTSGDRTNTDSKTVIAKDEKENQVVVPGGFKIAADSGDTVQKGIVIEDKEGNQFVWVPVSNVNADGSNKIIKDDGTEVEITLGRYTFETTTPGTPTLVQKGSEYAAVTAANVANGTVNTNYQIENCYELSDKNRLSNELKDMTGTNTTAKDLGAFINKTKVDKGFYIARYEASYGSGYNADGTTTEEKYGNAKPLSKKSTSKTNYYETGDLWNKITQPQAAMVSKNMYAGDNYVESDLVNSYAWDTAIVYIQAMGNTNYANANRDTNGNTTLKNTGETGDKVCNIFDMAANTREYTTEYSTYVGSSSTTPCTRRGGDYYNSSLLTQYRDYGNATDSLNRFSFRFLLYMK